MTAIQEMDEAELHERIIAKDPRAIEAWQERTMPMILGLVRKSRLSEEDGEEIWDDVLMAAVSTAPDRPVDGMSLRKFAVAVARNKIADRLRERIKAGPQTSLDDDVLAETLFKPDLAPDMRRVGALIDCLRTLRERYRVVLELQQSGYDAKEIAGLLDVLEGSVYQIAKRARDAMRVCIEGRLGA